MNDLAHEIHEAMLGFKSGWSVNAMMKNLNFERVHKVNIIHVAQAMQELADKRLIKFDVDKYYLQVKK